MVVIAKAQPSWPSRISQSTASTAETGIGPGTTPWLITIWVQAAKARITTAVTGAARRANAAACFRISPVVFRARNVEPCSTQMATRVSPTNTPNGVSRSQNEPVYSCDELIGSPTSRSPSATPISSGASSLPTVSSQSQAARQPTPSRLPRYSNERPRTIRATSSSTSAR